MRIQVDWSCLDEGVRDHADMDDTLVMTGDADLKAYTDVVKLAKQLHGKVGFLCVCSRTSIEHASQGGI